MHSLISRTRLSSGLAVLAFLLAPLLIGGPGTWAAESDSGLDPIVDRYARATGHKALAVTDGPRTAWAFTAAHATSREATQEAIRLCRARADEAGIETECRVAAVDQRVLDDRVRARLTRTTTGR